MNKGLILGSVLLILFAVGVLVGSLSNVPTEKYDNPRLADQQFVELVAPVVRIEGHAMLGERRATWRGSGVVVYSELNEIGSGYDSYVLTCNHVVEVPKFDPNSNPWYPEVTGITYGVDYLEFFDLNLNSNRKLPGVVVAQSNNNVWYEDENGDIRTNYDGTMTGDMGEPSGQDLALVRVLTNEPLYAAKLMTREKFDSLKLFFKARVVGCSLGFKPYHTFGEITRLDGDSMSVSAPFLPGNSGGACYLDSSHEFLGITNAGINGAPHLGLIRPLDLIYDWFDETGYSWIYNKSVSRADRFDKIRTDRASYDLGSWTAIQELQRHVEDLQSDIHELTNMVGVMKSDLEMTKRDLAQVNQQLEAAKDFIRGIISKIFMPVRTF